LCVDLARSNLGPTRGLAPVSSSPATRRVSIRSPLAGHRRHPQAVSFAVLAFAELACAAPPAPAPPPTATTQSALASLAETGPSNPLLRVDLLGRAARLDRASESTPDPALEAWLDEVLRDGCPRASEVGPEGVEALAKICTSLEREALLASRCLTAVEEAVEAHELSPRWADRVYRRVCETKASC